MSSAPPSRYSVLRKVADGGMAEIFLGVQRGARGFERSVILKRVRPEVSQDSELLLALHDEARIAMGLLHSNIAQVLDVGEAAGRTFLVLELVDGWSLAQVQRRARDAGEPLPLALALYVAAEVCRALGYAHAYRRDGQPLHIVHRDLSPQNVLISAEGEVKLTDFGIARAESKEVRTAVGLVKGKPGYMSPEQALGQPLDGRSDLFALGLVLYELCTGQRAYRGASDYEVLVKAQQAVLEPARARQPSLPAEVDELLARALAPLREERFPTAEVMLEGLERVQRQVLGAAGQTELKAWLQELSRRDGQRKLSERTAASPPADVPSLASSEAVDVPSELALLPSDVLRPPPPPPPEATTSRWPFILASLALAGLLGLLTVRSLELPAARGPVEEGPPVVLVPAEETVARDPPAAVEPAPEPPPPVEVAASVGPTPVPESPADAATLVEVVELPVPEPTPPAQVEEPSPRAIDDAGVPGPLEVVGPGSPDASAPEAAQETPETAYVLFTSWPKGASVRVERRTFGTTPVRVRFRTGLTFAATLELDGHEPREVRFTVTGEQEQVVKTFLRKKKAVVR